MPAKRGRNSNDSFAFDGVLGDVGLGEHAFQEQQQEPSPPDPAGAPPLASETDSLGGSGRFESVDFNELEGVACPCGVARRAFTQVADFPGTVHVTEIHETARRHYHQRLTETYYVLECSEDAYLELDDVRLPVRVGSCVLIRPYTRHRAVGKMKVLILVLPKFDEADEWFDEPNVGRLHEKTLPDESLP